MKNKEKSDEISAKDFVRFVAEKCEFNMKGVMKKGSEELREKRKESK